MEKRNRKRWWAAWLATTELASGALMAALLPRERPSEDWAGTMRKAFLPGLTTGGHHQIELACESCHGRPFAGREAMQQACVRCHGADLKEARDSHPKSKFTDPRNAERAARLDATRCVTCHVEHRPALTGAAGVTLAKDFCVICHADIGEDRTSHRGMAFDTCAGSGCHKFHDNRALDADFLVKHGSGAAAGTTGRHVPERDFRRVIDELSTYPIERFPLRSASAPDHAGRLRGGAAIEGEWLASSHARAGVNCSACHQEPGAKHADAAWVERPTPAACKSCHGAEHEGFLGGKHGMRGQVGFSPMTPALARLPMKSDAAHRELTCASCHGAHRFDTRRAALDACLGCHVDGHSRAYRSSPHFAAWARETSGKAAAGTGVSCATCHMPRVEHRQDDVKRILVQHNQNAVLRPGEKMIRTACLHCHGLAFSIDALADPSLAARNFAGRPAAHVKSIDMALEAERRAEESRRKARREPAA